MKKNIILGIVLICIGVVALVFSIICFGAETGHGRGGTTFGADFYTWVEQDASRITYNTTYTNEILSQGFAFAFLLAFFAFTGIGVCNLICCKHEGAKATVAPQPAVEKSETETTDIDETF